MKISLPFPFEDKSFASKDQHRYTKGIFENKLDIDAKKQLEKLAKNYDLLRSSWKLNLMRRKMNIQNLRPEDSWLNSLKFPGTMTESEESLFHVVNKETCLTELIPEVGTYYHPKFDGHPLIDRFFLIFICHDLSLFGP